MSKNVCVILSGCGFLDGAEIHEAVLTLLCIENHGGTWECCAPNVEFDVVDHITQKPTGEKRNVLTESARIARGNIKDIADVRADNYAVLVIPGGYGAAKNLSNFASAGTNATVHPEVERLINEFLAQKKPIAAICIAPATLARVTANAKLETLLTVGNKTDHADAVAGITTMGGVKHIDCPVDQAVFDEPNKIVTTPAYMLGPGPKDVMQGIDHAVRTVLKWA